MTLIMTRLTPPPVSQYSQRLRESGPWNGRYEVENVLAPMTSFQDLHIFPNFVRSPIFIIAANST